MLAFDIYLLFECLNPRRRTGPIRRKLNLPALTSTKNISTRVNSARHELLWQKSCEKWAPGQRTTGWSPLKKNQPAPKS